MSSNTTATVDPSKMYDYIDEFITNRNVIIVVVIILIIYIFSIFFGSSSTNSGYSQGVSNYLNTQNTQNTSSSFIIMIIILIFCFLVFLGIFKFVFGINILVNLNKLFEKEIDIIIEEPVAKIAAKLPIPKSITSQVFNIPGNNYTYDDAKSLCKAYDSKIATYKQIENAYNNGAEWCNYGWSDDQIALFPTQQKTFDELQKVKGHENDCGRPGVNGGFIGNPQVRFGVNCYGKKPEITEDEKLLMKNTPLYPLTNEEILLDKRTEYWKNHLSQILVSPFNHKTWSRI